MNKICIGAGLISLDILINDFESSRPVSYYVGGTCGNVMMILSHMGWNCYPMARLDNSKYAIRLIDDLKCHGVHTDFITSSESGKTPVIKQHNQMKDDGKPYHHFEFVGGNGRFLNYTPVTVKAALDAANTLSFKPGVFFFDRISPSNIRLASAMKGMGAMIVFEPSCKIDTPRFGECVMLSDIVKFSDQRISEISYFDDIKDKLFIQTMGENGLRFKMGNSSWSKVPPILNETILDTSGAGDWTTAAFLNFMFDSDNRSLLLRDKSLIEKMLYKAQQIGSLSCSYQGARGMMDLSWENIMRML